jgi:hypothetical protein
MVTRETTKRVKSISPKMILSSFFKKLNKCSLESPKCHHDPGLEDSEVRKFFHLVAQVPAIAKVILHFPEDILIALPTWGYDIEPHEIANTWLF